MKKPDAFTWVILAFCAALNISVGFLVQALRLPIYLDSLGTILATALVGLPAGLLVGLVSLLLLAVITAPTALAYAGTVVIIAISVSVFRKWKYLEKWPSTIVLGILLGIIAAAASAPVTTYLFGGVSLAGADAVTAFFSATGQTLLNSVVLGGLATDPVDKLIASIICHLILWRLPARMRDRFRGLRQEAGE